MQLKVTLDDSNAKAVQIISDRLGVSMSRAVNILMREGLQYVTQFDTEGNPLRPDSAPDTRTRASR